VRLSGQLVLKRFVQSLDSTSEGRMDRQCAGNQDPDLLEEYDFSKGVRGKYAKRYREGTNLVRLDDDVAAMFPSAKSVNDALRALAKIIDQHEKHAEPTTR
jgi:hypothetical protein